MPELRSHLSTLKKIGINFLEDLAEGSCWSDWITDVLLVALCAVVLVRWLPFSATATSPWLLIAWTAVVSYGTVALISANIQGAVLIRRLLLRNGGIR